MVYLDSSAVVKLVVPELESQALRRYLAVRYDRVASGLVRVEVLRALRRAHVRDPAAWHAAERILASIALLAIDEPVLRAAAHLQPERLRSLHAVHLATVLSLEGLEAVVTYDQRLHHATAEAGLNVASPA